MASSESKEKDGTITLVNSLPHAKLVIEEYRRKLRLVKLVNEDAAPIGAPVIGLVVHKGEEKLINNANKEEVLKLMEAEDIDVDNLVLIPEDDIKSKSAREIYKQYFTPLKQEYENIVMAMPGIEGKEINAEDIPEGVLFMEYVTDATHWVYDAEIALLAHKDSEEEPGIPDLKRDAHKGYYIYLPKIKRADIERIKNAIELYKKVLMAA